MSYIGRDFILKLSGTQIASVTVVNQEWIREVLDKTAGDDEGWQTFHGTPARRGVNLSIEGYVESTNKTQLSTMYNGLSNSAITLETPYTGVSDVLVLSAAGGFAMTALSFGAAEKELVSFSASFSSSGEVTEEEA